jgi:hypothetical protein
VSQRRQVVLRLGQPVLERLEHGLHRGERRAEIVARPRDELAPRVEQALDVLRHLVEGSRNLSDLGGPLEGRPHAQLAARQGRGRGAQAVERTQDRAAEEKPGADRRGRRGSRDRKNRQVVSGAEHDRAGDDDGDQWKQDGNEAEADESEADRRQPAECKRGEKSARKRRQRHDQREENHEQKR